MGLFSSLGRLVGLNDDDSAVLSTDEGSNTEIIIDLSQEEAESTNLSDLIDEMNGDGADSNQVTQE